MRLEGRTTLITGAAGGIGSATARAFAREGADLCLSDVSDTSAIAAEVGALGRKAVEVRTDVTDRAEVQKMVEAALEGLGRIDILVTVAGVTSLGNADSVDEAEWDRVIDINLKGTWLCCQAVMAPMRAQKYGRIVTVGSLIGKNGGNPRPWLNRDEQLGSSNVAYGASKAAVHNLSANLAREWAPLGIRVNTLVPGFFPAEQNRKVLTPDRVESVMRHTPFGRFGEPQELLGATILLASDAGAFITGTEMIVDGGFSNCTI